MQAPSDLDVPGTAAAAADDAAAAEAGAAAAADSPLGTASTS